MAGPGEALVEVALAVLTNEPSRAGARVAADAVQTLASVETARLPGALLRGAVIHVLFTLLSCKSRNPQNKDTHKQFFRAKLLEFFSRLTSNASGDHKNIK